MIADELMDIEVRGRRKQRPWVARWLRGAVVSTAVSEGRDDTDDDACVKDNAAEVYVGAVGLNTLWHQRLRVPLSDLSGSRCEIEKAHYFVDWASGRS